MIAKSILASAAVAASLGAGGVVHASNEAHLQSMANALSAEFGISSTDTEAAIREFKGVRGTRIAENGNDGQAHLEAFSNAFANEFGLNADEVETTLQAYVDTRHEARADHSGMTKAEKLQAAVETGRITQEEADAIAAKHNDNGGHMTATEKAQKAFEAGIFTEDQANAVADMQVELQALKETLPTMTEADRLAAVKDQALEIQDWADENDINLGGKIGEGRTDNLKNLKIDFHSHDHAPLAVPAPTPAPAE